MYIATVPNRNSPPAILLRESFRRNGKVLTRTLANLTHWSPQRTEALRRALKGQFDGLSDQLQPTCGPVFGVLFALKQIADRVGLSQVLGKERLAKLALFLILARVANQGSRLSAVRWAQSHAVAETLGLDRFDEEDLYGALDWLAQRQEPIEKKLYRLYRNKQGGPPTVVLYDVTSSYLEGECNELAAFGYNRDKKAGKTQIVIGLLTAAEGEPLAVKVFCGNTADPVTVKEQVETLKSRFGIHEVVLVGDRGMVKSKGKKALAEANFKYITALTDPQVRKLLKQGVIKLEDFEEKVHEVEHGSVRLVMRRSEAARLKEQRRRQDKVEKLKELVVQRNAFVSESKRAEPQVGLRTVRAWMRRHKLGGFVEVALQDRQLTLTIDERAQAQAAWLDGCCVLETDVPSTALDAHTVYERYVDLHEVEQDFRTMKTTLLEVRPIFVRKAQRTRAHVLVTMLALKVVREMRRGLVAAFGTTEDNKMAVRVEEALMELSRLCLLIYPAQGACVTRLPRPDERQAAILQALGTPLPSQREVEKM
jgi:transposase